MITQVEQSWRCNHINSGVMSVIKLSTISLETAYPMSFHEISRTAFGSVRCLLFEINSDSRKVVVSLIIRKIFAIRAINIRIELRH